MVPVALAYAGLAGVPPELGLVTAFVALAVYAVFGTSRHLKVTTSSTMAVMSASVVVGLAGGDPALYLALTSALALTVGAILVAAGIAKLGFISDFLAKSVVTGFIAGLAITIIIGQLPKILGVPSLSGSLPEQIVQLIGELPNTNPYTLAVGLTSLAPDPRPAPFRAASARVADRARAGDPCGVRPRSRRLRHQRGRRGGDRDAPAVDPVRPAHDPALPRPRRGGDRLPRGRRVRRRRPRVRRAPRLRDRRGPGDGGPRGGQHRARACSAASRPMPACPRPPRPRARAPGPRCHRW